MVQQSNNEVNNNDAYAGIIGGGVAIGVGAFLLSRGKSGAKTAAKAATPRAKSSPALLDAPRPQSTSQANTQQDIIDSYIRQAQTGQATSSVNVNNMGDIGRSADDIIASAKKKNTLAQQYKNAPVVDANFSDVTQSATSHANDAIPIDHQNIIDGITKPIPVPTKNVITEGNERAAFAKGLEEDLESVLEPFAFGRPNNYIKRDIGDYQAPAYKRAPQYDKPAGPEIGSSNSVPYNVILMNQDNRALNNIPLSTSDINSSIKTGKL